MRVLCWFLGHREKRLTGEASPAVLAHLDGRRETMTVSVHRVVCERCGEVLRADVVLPRHPWT